MVLGISPSGFDFPKKLTREIPLGSGGAAVIREPFRPDVTAAGYRDFEP
jgi:hypothetical protein